MGESRHTRTSYCKSVESMIGGHHKLNKFKIRRSQVLTPFLLLILVLPSLIAFAAPIKEDPSSEIAELLTDIQPLVDESIDEEAVIEQAESLLRSQFMENRGQVGNNEVLLYGNIPGGMIGFAVSKVLVWLDGAPNCITFSFVDSTATIPTFSNIASHRTNYFLGDRGTYTDVKSFNEVVYSELWPGIDLIYRATPSGAKYEYHVSANVNPDKIIVNVDNFDELVVEDKILLATISDIQFHDSGLIAYQDGLEVNANFKQIGSDNFGFNLGTYDTSQPLIIDPLIYSTYVGGSSNDGSTPDSTQFGMAADSSGNVYVCGVTQSSDFPMVNAYDSTFIGPGGTYDSFVFKLNSTGNGLEYSTFIAGNDHDVARAIAVDSSGNAYITGFTESDDFPILNAYDSTYNFGRDPFVLKLNSTGNGLIYSTYVAGSAFYESAFDILVDDLGYAYVTGYTESSNFPRVNAYDSTHNGGEDCFLFKLSPNGDSLEFSTFYGGGGDDFARGIAVDTEYNIYLTGYTQSSNLPMQNSLNSTHGGGNDCFVAKFDSSASSLLFATFVGGSGDSEGWGIDVDSLNQTYVSGITTSSNFPTYNGYDMTHNGGQDSFVFMLNSTGNGLVYSTFVGGTGNERGGSLAVDSVGAVYVTGYTSSDTFPLVNPSHTVYSNVDGFVFKLDPTGQNLLYSTYMGGDSWDYAYQIIIDSSGNAFVAGNTYSSNFPTTNAYDDTSNGASDVFVFKLPDMGDSDSDQLPDYYEVLNGTNRYDPDSDDDSLSDFVEVTIYNSDPLNASDPAWIEHIGYSTYIGGSSQESPLDIVVDSQGNAYVTGSTISTDFPTMNGIDETYNGNDIFLMKIGPHGEQLLWSTYIGGSSYDYINAIAVDNFDNVYLTGSTLSSDFPTVNAYMDTYTYRDGFVMKINSAGDTLLYSTFIAGTNEDYPQDIVVDAAGNAYVTGFTYSSSFPTLHAYDYIHNGVNDGFIFKLNSAGNGLIFSTFLGGNDADHPMAIAIDTSNNVYIFGETDSLDFPLKNPLDDYNNGHDLFISKLNSTGNGLEFSTYFGGNENSEMAAGIKVDSNGDVYVVGTSYGIDFPMTKLIGEDDDESDDIFVLKLNSTGNGMIYCTIVAGTDCDFPQSMSVDASGAVYVASPTDSNDLPVVNPVGTPTGNSDCYVMKLSPNGQYLEFASYVGGVGDDYEPFMAIDDRGRFYVTACTNSNIFPLVNSTGSTYNGTPDAFVMRIDTTEDSDLDGIPNLWENSYGLDPYNASDAALDPDADLLTNFQEYKYGGSPFNNDSDSDTISDFDEAMVYNTYPDNSDSDGDLISDPDEIGVYGTNPLRADSDSDNLDDYSEIFVYFTNPNSYDSDSDRVSDEREIIGYSTDPLNGSDPDWSNWMGFATTFGTEHVWIEDITIDAFDNVYVIGNERSDAFIMKFNDAGDLIFVTFFGGSSWETLKGIVVDGSGIITAMGVTGSTNLPLMNALDTTLNGTKDFMLFRLDASGSSLIFSTYLGGSDREEYGSIDMDGLGRIYVSGSTLSTDYPTVNAIYDTKVSNFDLVVTRISSDGSTIEYSTYIGGDNTDSFQDICVDDNGNVYLTGYTKSSDFPTVNAYDSSLTSGHAGFVVKINSIGSGIDFSTYIENSIGETEISAIEVDANGVIYFVGHTNTLTGFPLVNHNNSTIYSTTGCFVTLLNNTGSEILYSTIVADGWPLSMDIDDFGNVYVAGGHYDFPVIGGYIASYNEGGDEVFFFKLDTKTHSVEFSAQIGGADDDMCTALALDSYSRPILACYAESPNFPVIGTTTRPFVNSYGVLLRIEVGDLDLDNIPDTWEDANGLDKNNSSDAALDPDLDSLTNLEEYTYRCNPHNNDTDFDNLNDWEEIYTHGTNPRNNDSDFDSMPDDFEITFGLNPALNDATGDIDFDSLSNFQEYLLGTYPNNNDTDSDMIQDGWEYYHGLDPTFDDASDDPDFDSLSNYLEYVLGAEPFNNDTDSDTLLDGVEYHTYGTSPTNADTDFDLMPDDWELTNGLDPLVDDAYDDLDFDLLINLFEWGNGTLANNNDTDSDLMPDGWEINNALNATINDALDDLDGDTLSNLGEYQNGTLPWDPDCDSDTLSDGAEVLIHHTNPLSAHSDADIMPDGWEVLYGLDPTDPHSNDSDSDLMPDGWEVTYGLNPLVNDALSSLDSDSLSNLYEYQIGTFPNNSDSDSDLMPDDFEVINDLNPLLDDAADDYDSDTLSNLLEYQIGTSANNTDSDSDLMPDGWEVSNGLMAVYRSIVIQTQIQCRMVGRYCMVSIRWLMILLETLTQTS